MSAELCYVSNLLALDVVRAANACDGLFAAESMKYPAETMFFLRSRENAARFCVLYEKAKLNMLIMPVQHSNSDNSCAAASSHLPLSVLPKYVRSRAFLRPFEHSIIR